MRTYECEDCGKKITADEDIIQQNGWLTAINPYAGPEYVYLCEGCADTHATGCICADCSGAELIADND